MTVTRVHHLNCGTMCPLGRGAIGQGGLLGRGTLVAHCLLLETARDGLILVDTGLSSHDCAEPERLPKSLRLLTAPRLDPQEPAVRQIEALGFTAADVRHIVVTHLDFDHAGGLIDFPGATVHVHAREHAAAIARSTGNERRRYLPSQWAHAVTWQTYDDAGDTWRGLPAIARLRGVHADLGLLPLAGHTRGHSAVFVTAPTGAAYTALVHAGDAYFHRGALASPPQVPWGLRTFERMMQVDGPARIASAAALRTLASTHPDLRVFCAHDPVELATLASRH